MLINFIIFGLFNIFSSLSFDILEYVFCSNSIGRFDLQMISSILFKLWTISIFFGFTSAKQLLISSLERCAKNSIKTNKIELLEFKIEYKDNA